MGLRTSESGDISTAPSPKAGAVFGPEAYRDHVRKVMSVADWPWPEHVLLNPEKMPRFVHTVEEFIQELQMRNHMNEVVVFPGGLYAVGQDGSLHRDFAEAAGFGSSDAPKTTFDVLKNLAQKGVLNKFKGKVQFRLSKESRKDTAAHAWKNNVLGPKWEDLETKCTEEAKESVYLAEMRLSEREPTSDTSLRNWRKSSLLTTMRERMHKLGMDVESMVYWDDYSEGTFCGAGSSGYDLHADCIPTSNIGSVFSGHKMLAIWKFGDDTKKVLKEHGREQFTKPLLPSQVEALEAACRVAVAPPGSLYIFSGCCAHSVANVGFSAPGPAGVVPSLIVSSYEAFVGLGQDHLAAMNKVCNQCQADSDTDEEIMEFEEDLVDDSWKMHQRLESGAIHGAAEAKAVHAALESIKSQNPRIRAELEQKEESKAKRMRCEGSPAKA